MGERGVCGGVLLSTFTQSDVMQLHALHNTDNLLTVARNFPLLKAAMVELDPRFQSKRIVDELNKAFTLDGNDPIACARALCSAALRIYMSGIANGEDVSEVLAVIDARIASAKLRELDAVAIEAELARVAGDLIGFPLAIWEGLKSARVAHLAKARPWFMRLQVSEEEFAMFERASVDGTAIVRVLPSRLRAVDCPLAGAVVGGVEILAVVESRFNSFSAPVAAVVSGISSLDAEGQTLLPPFSALTVRSVRRGGSLASGNFSPAIICGRDVTFEAFGLTPGEAACATLAHERDTALLEAEELRARLVAAEADLASMKHQNEALAEELDRVKGDAATTHARLLETQMRLVDEEAKVLETQQALTQMREEKVALEEAIVWARRTGNGVPMAPPRAVLGGVLLEGGECKGASDPARRALLIPATAREVAANAFKGSALEELWCEDGSMLERIGAGAFLGCKKLRCIKLQPGLRSIAGDWDNGAFEGCTGLSSIVLPASITNIGPRTFWGCTGLTTLELPAGLTAVERFALAWCTGLTSVTFPARLAVIGEAAFRGCTGLTALQLPSSLTMIDKHAFYGCVGLASLRLPSSLGTLGEGAFKGCTGLTTMQHRSGLTSIGEGAFEGCSGLTILQLRPGLTVVEKFTFRGCVGLTLVQLPPGLVTVGEDAFAGCTGLKSLQLPSGLANIDKFAFAGCTSLTSLQLPAGLAGVGFRAFFGCSGIRTVRIPMNTRLASEAFPRECHLERV